MPHPAETYLKNREDFYAVLLPRIPIRRFRDLLTEAVQPWAAADELAQEAERLGNSNESVDILQSLDLVDWLKKPAQGKTAAKLVISVESALEYSIHLEQVGILLFQNIVNTKLKQSESFRSELERRKSSHSNLLRLSDEIRYHKVRLDP